MGCTTIENIVTGEFIEFKDKSKFTDYVRNIYIMKMKNLL